MRLVSARLTHDGVHILRHTFCSHLAMRGAPARAIQELAGHTDLSMTQRYMHLSPAALDAAIRLLEQPESGPSFADGSAMVIGLQEVLWQQQRKWLETGIRAKSQRSGALRDA